MFNYYKDVCGWPYDVMYNVKIIYVPSFIQL